MWLPELKGVSVLKNTLQKLMYFSHQKGVSVELKWTKSRQKDKQVFVTLPKLGDHIVDPVYNFKQFFKFSPNKSQLKPLLAFVDGGVMSANFICKTFKKELSILDSGNRCTFHSLRKSAATHTFGAGAKALAIAKQGTWKSEVYVDYIVSQKEQKCPLENEFKLLFGVMVNNPIYGTVAQITDAIKSDNSMDPIGTHNFSI